MPKENVETVREFIFAGSFSSDVVIGAAVILGLFVAVLAWWECRRTNRWLFPLFVLLRWGAIAVVVWMLLEPTIRTRIRHETAKSVAILVDRSASMGVVDPGGSSVMAVRWAAANNPSSRSAAIVGTDSAAASLESAFVHMKRFVSAWQSGRSRKTLEHAAVSACKSVNTAADRLEDIVPIVQAEHMNPGSDLNEIRSRLGKEVLPELEAFVRDIEDEQLLLSENRVQQLGKVLWSLERYSGRLHRVAEELADEYAADPDEATKNLMEKQSKMTRLERVTRLLEEGERSWLKDVKREAKLVCYSFDSNVYPLAEESWSGMASADRSGEGFSTEGLSTDLTAAMGQIALDQASKSVEAAVVLTDGGHNAERDPLKVASAMSDLPLYIVPVGDTEPLRDIILHHVQSPRAVMENDLIVIDAMVDAHGCEGERLVIELQHENEVTDAVEIEVPSDTFARRLTFTQKAEELGVQTFRLRVREVPDERVEDNNKAEFNVEVIEDKIRVLLIDNMPRWEYRYLRNLFRRDERIEFEELLFQPRESGSGRPARGSGFPEDLDAWSLYRVVIIGDVPPDELNARQQDLLEEYVDRRGGTLILIAGEESMPGWYVGHTLEKMIPIELSPGPLMDDTQGFDLFVTSEGRLVQATQLADDPLASDRIWTELLPVYGLSEYSMPKPTSHILVGASARNWRGGERATERAFLCWQYYGKGRVVYLSAPVTYRLRFRQGDTHHHRFWGQLLRWAVAREMASGAKTVKISTDKTRYVEGDEVQVTVWLSDRDGGAVSGAACRVLARQEGLTIGTEELKEEEGQPGVYHGVFKDLPTGSMVMSVAGPEVVKLLAEEGFQGSVETEITVEPPETLELRNTRCNLPLLTQIAESTGGMIIPPTSLGAALQQLDFSPEASETISQQPLWTRWMLLWIFLGCLATEWGVRKLTGMA